MRRLGLIVKSRRDRITQSWSREQPRSFFQASTEEKPTVSLKNFKRAEFKSSTYLKNWKKKIFLLFSFHYQLTEGWGVYFQVSALRFYNQIFSLAALLHQQYVFGCAEEVHGSLLGAFRDGTKIIPGSASVCSDFFEKYADESFTLREHHLTKAHLTWGLLYNTVHSCICHVLKARSCSADFTAGFPVFQMFFQKSCLFFRCTFFTNVLPTSKWKKYIHITKLKLFIYFFCCRCSAWYIFIYVEISSVFLVSCFLVYYIRMPHY